MTQPAADKDYFKLALGCIIMLVFAIAGAVYALRWPITIALIVLILFQGRI